MSFETSKFGDGSAAGAGNVIATVHNHFGQRTELDEESVGIINTEGALNELVIDFDAATLTAAAYPLMAPKLPAGAKITRVLLEVRTAFALGGTTPAIEIGTEGSEVTNGFTITEAQAEAVGMYDLTSALSGTWAAQLAADTTVGIALTGTTPTNGTVGRARAVIQYANF